MTSQDREALRRELIVHAEEAVLDIEEAAALMGVSTTWLKRSDVPRAPVAGVKFLKSQCLAYVRARLTHVITPEET